MPNQTLDAANLSVTHIGGITDSRLSLAPGISVLVGKNATNRTSLLSALNMALGGTTGTVHSGFTYGEVELTIDGDQYTRIVKTTDNVGQRVFEGEPYCDSSVLVDNYATILGENPGRRCVREGGDLREFLMAPIDEQEIQSTITELRRRRDEIDSRLDTIEMRRTQLPKLEEQRRELDTELAEFEAEIESLEAEIEAHDQAKAADDAGDELVEALEAAREQLNSRRGTLETTTSVIESLTAEREELQAERESIQSVTQETHDEIADRLQHLRTRQSELADVIDSLLAVVEFNNKVLDGEIMTVAEPKGAETMSPTDELLAEETQVECWTCGSMVDLAAVHDQTAEFQERLQEHRAERREVEDEIESLEQRQSKIESRIAREDEIETRLDEIETRLTEERTKQARLEDEITELRDEITELEAKLDAVETDAENTLAALYQELSDAGYRQGQLENELASVEAEIQEIETLDEERAALEQERTDVAEELEAARTRIADTERSIVEVFNEQMAAVLDVLEYGNLERVWLERLTDANGTDPDSDFALHIVRKSPDGAVRDEPVSHLSESEREVIGILTAVAGYLAHDVSDEVPFLLFDSLESIDADRIRVLLEYLADQAEFVAVALLPEDADDRPAQSQLIPAEEF